MVSQEPVRIDLRMYDVGFGDCFLLSFTYPVPVDGRAVRHMLIDFGTKAMPKGGATSRDIANLIAADCGGKLDVVVVTHRHQDHLSGFAPGAGGDVIAGLRPDRVLRPWTEAPDAAPADPAATDPAGTAALSLVAGQSFARAIAELTYPSRPTDVQRQMLRLADLQVPNAEAMDVLRALSDDGRGRYLRLGGDTGTLDLLPGVRMRVLGPPDPALAPDLYHYAGSSSEYWLRLTRDLSPSVQSAMLAGAADDVGGDPGPTAPAESVRDSTPPGPARWLLDRLERRDVRSAFELVRTFDKVLNNTSLILLIEAAGHSMLFPGDAQLEDWDYCLNNDQGAAALQDDLKRVDLYKVGHHGSRNATPKLSLYPLLQASTAGHCLAVMSTMPGVFKDAHPVPAKALVDALSVLPFRLLSTADLPPTTRPPVRRVVAGAGTPFADVPA